MAVYICFLLLSLAFELAAFRVMRRLAREMERGEPLDQPFLSPTLRRLWMLRKYGTLMVGLTLLGYLLFRPGHFWVYSMSLLVTLSVLALFKWISRRWRRHI